LAVAALLVALYALYRKLVYNPIADLPGPEAESFILGNLRQYFQSQAGEIDYKWQEAYGDVIKFNGPMGEHRLMISDPKALQYIYQTAGYTFAKQFERREISRLMAGRGVLWADGPDHRRQRRIMNPAFGAHESKAFVPLFTHYASKLSNKWRDILATSPDSSQVFDMVHWISRATLDAIGEAAFDCHFDSLENSTNELTKVYSGFAVSAFGRLSSLEIFRQAVTAWLPKPLLVLWSDKSPDRRSERLRHAQGVATQVAKRLLDSKTDAFLAGKGNRDVLSLLVHANISEDEKTRMSEEEMISTMRALMIAGHESTATSLTWVLLELSKQPHIQNRLREEILKKAGEIGTRGDSGFTANDLDSMPYLNAVVKESLRYNPVAYSTHREAMKDDVLPLSKPITTRSGKVITELHVPKGMKVVTSINGYNRNKDIFGADSHIYDPERWLIPGRVEKASPVGVYGNLLTFAGGVRSCVGWRFAVAEMQAFIVELVGNFEFSLTPESQKVRREACLLMTPTIEGQIEKGNQLPLAVKMVSRAE
jgi:cytochrome P450